MIFDTERRSARAARTAEQRAVAAADVSHAVTRKPGDRDPNRVFVPCLGVILEVREDLFGDLSIARAGHTSVEDAKHQACPVAALRREAWVGRNTLPEHSVPETLDSDQSVQRQFVEHDERAEGTSILRIGEFDVVGLAP